MCIVALLSLNRWREERRVDWRFADPRSAILSFARLSFVTALAWGVLMALLAATPDGLESLLATFCMIGVKTVVALTAASVPLASLAFLGGSCIGAVLTIVFGHLPPRIVVTLVVFMILFARSILVQANLFIVNHQAELDLATATRERIEAKLQARVARVAQGLDAVLAQLTTLSSLADEIETETAGQTRVTGAIVEDARRAATVAADLRGGVERSIDSSAAMRTLTERVAISGTAVARQVQALSDAAQSFLTDLRAA